MSDPLRENIKTQEAVRGVLASIQASSLNTSPYKEFWMEMALSLYYKTIEQLEKEAVDIEMTTQLENNVLDTAKSDTFELLNALDLNIQELFEKAINDLNIPLCKILLYCGSDPTIHNYGYYYMVADNVELLTLLLKHHEPDAKMMHNILHKASCSLKEPSSTLCVKLLLTTYNMKSGEDWLSAFDLSCKLGYRDKVTLFLDSGKIPEAAKRRAYSFVIIMKLKKFSRNIRLNDAVSIFLCVA